MNNLELIRQLSSSVDVRQVMIGVEGNVKSPQHRHIRGVGFSDGHFLIWGEQQDLSEEIPAAEPPPKKETT